MGVRDQIPEPDPRRRWSIVKRESLGLLLQPHVNLRSRGEPVIDASDPRPLTHGKVAEGPVVFIDILAGRKFLNDYYDVADRIIRVDRYFAHTVRHVA